MPMEDDDAASRVDGGHGSTRLGSTRLETMERGVGNDGGFGVF